MKSRVISGILVIAFLGVSNISFAQEEPTNEPAAPAYSYGITLSPIHLAIPMVEVTVEYGLEEKMSIAAIGGLGKIATETTTLSGTTKDSFTAIEVGAQFRYYVLGNLTHGMQVGAEALYLHLDRDETDSVSGTGEGLAVGPFVGYKIATESGFTFDTQLGFQYVTAKAEVSAGNVSASTDDSDFIPLLNLNLGWSF